MQGKMDERRDDGRLAKTQIAFNIVHIKGIWTKGKKKNNNKNHVQLFC